MARSWPRLVGICLGLGLTLSGCGSAPPMQRLPDMTFLYKPPIRLNIARVEVVSKYVAPAAHPNIEYDMPVSPEAAVRKWAADRLQPVGKSGILRVVINRASATETPLTTDQGLTGMFKEQPKARVEEAIDVSLEMLDDRQFTVADASGTASRSFGEPEDQKLNQRDQLLWDQTYDMVRGFDREMDGKIRIAFANWIDNSP